MRPPDSNQQLNDTLAELAREFTSSVPARLDAIRIAFENSKDKDWSATSVADLHRHIHSLVGATGTFGETDLSAGARKILDAMIPFTTDGPRVENGDAERIAVLIFEFLDRFGRIS